MRFSAAHFPILVTFPKVLACAAVIASPWRSAAAQSASARKPALDSSLVLGVVEDSAERGIPSVQISIVGQNAAGISDDHGRFRIGPLRAQSYIFQFRRLGYAPVTAVTDLSTADTLRLAIEMIAATTTLAPVEVKATSSDRKLEQVGFVRRRMDGAVPPSRFITRAEFERRPPFTMTELLERMGGVSRRCLAASVYVDGALMASDPPPDSITNSKGKRVPADGFGAAMKRSATIDMIPPSSVAAVEAYTGPAEIPLEYKTTRRGSSCVILIWTRVE